MLRGPHYNIHLTHEHRDWYAEEEEEKEDEEATHTHNSTIVGMCED